MRNFKELKIWQKGFDIAITACRLTGSVPKDGKYGITAQITRAAVSIASNIAEGSSRASEKEYSRFMKIALCFGFEPETQLLIAQAVKYGDSEICNQLLKDIDEEQKTIMRFMNKLNK